MKKTVVVLSFIIILTIILVLGSCGFMIKSLISVTNLNLNKNVVNNTNSVKNVNSVQCGHCYCGEINVQNTKDIFFMSLKEHNVSFIEQEILEDVISKASSTKFSGLIFSESGLILVASISVNLLLLVVISVMFWKMKRGSQNRLKKLQEKSEQISIVLDRLETLTNGNNLETPERSILPVSQYHSTGNLENINPAI